MVDKLRVSVETCPHYLYFAAEEIPDGDTRFKCAPPIRGRSDRERLWQAVGDGIIFTIGSDHSPAPPDMKLLDPSHKPWPKGRIPDATNRSSHMRCPLTLQWISPDWA